jgi:hypothetical protein
MEAEEFRILENHSRTSFLTVLPSRRVSRTIVRGYETYVFRPTNRKWPLVVRMLGYPLPLEGRRPA